MVRSPPALVTAKFFLRQIVESLATSWKQDFKLNLLVSWKLAFNLLTTFQNLATTKTLSVPKENLRVTKQPLLSKKPKLISIALLSLIRLSGIFTGTVVLSCLEQPVVIKPVNWSIQRHICGESLRLEVGCDCTLHQGRMGQTAGHKDCSRGINPPLDSSLVEVFKLLLHH